VWIFLKLVGVRCGVCSELPLTRRHANRRLWSFFFSDIAMTAVTVSMLHCRELSSVGDHDIKFMEMRGGSFDDVFQHIRVSLQMRQQTVVGMSRV
jgi:hypothetical protein